LTQAGHLFVNPTAGENGDAVVAIITVQATIVLHAGYPDNRVVHAVGRSDPGRASAAVVDVPGKSDGRRSVRVNYIGAKFAALSMKSEMGSFTSLVSSRRRTSERGTGNVHLSNRWTDTTQVVSIKQIRVAIFAQGEHEL
jgi:hypothetical protein